MMSTVKEECQEFMSLVVHKRLQDALVVVGRQPETRTMKMTEESEDSMYGIDSTCIRSLLAVSFALGWGCSG